MLWNFVFWLFFQTGNTYCKILEMRLLEGLGKEQTLESRKKQKAKTVKKGATSILKNKTSKLILKKNTFYFRYLYRIFVEKRNAWTERKENLFFWCFFAFRLFGYFCSRFKFCWKKSRFEILGERMFPPP